MCVRLAYGKIGAIAAITEMQFAAGLAGDGDALSPELYHEPQNPACFRGRNRVAGADCGTNSEHRTPPAQSPGIPGLVADSGNHLFRLPPGIVVHTRLPRGCP